MLGCVKEINNLNRTRKLLGCHLPDPRSTIADDNNLLRSVMTALMGQGAQQRRETLHFFQGSNVGMSANLTILSCFILKGFINHSTLTLCVSTAEIASTLV